MFAVYTEWMYIHNLYMLTPILLWLLSLEGDCLPISCIIDVVCIGHMSVF